MKIRDEYEARLTQFHDEFTEEETDTFARSLTVAGEMIELGFGPQFGASAMALLYQHLTGTELDTSNGWREAFRDLNASADVPFTPSLQQAHDLHAFAFYGIIPSWSHPGPVPVELEMARTDVPAYINQAVTLLEQFMSLFGKSAPAWGFEVIEKTILAARGRLKVDNDEPMSVHELAALSRVITKRVQNAIYAGSEGSPIVGTDGLITPASARMWLDARGYLPSIWREFTSGRPWDADDEEAPISAGIVEEIGDFIFIPEASDGSVFGPTSCGRGPEGDRRYTVGEKGWERIIVGYDEALSELIKMVRPRWRRPNPNGNFGIVRAERWRRVRRSDLANL